MTMAWLFLLLFAGHLLVAGTALPMAQRCLPQNRWRGLRTRESLAEERVWFEANAILGRFMLRATAISGCTVAVLFNLFPAGVALVLAMGVFVIAEGTAILLAFAVLRRKGLVARR